MRAGRVAAIARASGRAAAGHARSATPPPDPFSGIAARGGPPPVPPDRDGGRILPAPPPPGPGGVATRFLRATTLRTGAGWSEARPLAFPPVARRIAIPYDKSRFRGAAAPANGQRAARDRLSTRGAWMGDVAAALADLWAAVDVAPLFSTDVVGIGPAPAQADAKGVRRVPRPIDRSRPDR